MLEASDGDRRVLTTLDAFWTENTFLHVLFHCQKYNLGFCYPSAPPT